MFWVPAMIFDVPDEMSMLVCDLHCPDMLSDSPISNHQVSADSKVFAVGSGHTRTSSEAKIGLLYRRL